MVQQDVVFQRPERSYHKFLNFRYWESKQNVDGFGGMQSKSLVHTYNGFLLDSL